MVKLIVGKKGTGKTKMLIEQVNAAVEASKGCVICIEKGLTLNKDITHKARLVDMISIAPCCILIAHAFGRVGCFFAGCCYGKPTDSFLGVQFPGMSQKVHPTQLYEAIFLFALFTLCYLLYWKKNFKHNLSLYLVVYGIFRFCIEYLRGDDRGQLIGMISPSQFWSILMIVGGVAVYFLLEWLFKKRDEELALAAEEASKVEQAEEQAQTETTSVEDIEESDNKTVSEGTESVNSEVIE